jgi:hypothetical protein
MKIVVIANVGERTCLRVLTMAPRRRDLFLLNGSHLLQAPFRRGAESPSRTGIGMRGACAPQSEE